MINQNSVKVEGRLIRMAFARDTFEGTLACLTALLNQTEPHLPLSMRQ